MVKLMTKKDKQKKIESEDFELFRCLLKEQLPAKLEHDDNPDFLVYLTDGSLLGIEHTRVYKQEPNGYSLQAQENHENQVAEMARKYAELIGMRKLVLLNFNDLKGLNEKSRRDLACRIVKRIKIERALDGTITPEDSYNTEDSELSERVQDISFNSVTSDRKGSWLSFKAGKVLKDSRKVIMESINKKEGKYQKYIKKCDKCWLLVVADMKPSSFIHPDQESLDYVYSSSFDRIYFMDITKQELYLLKTSKTE